LESKGSFNEKWKGLVLAIFSFVGMIAIFKVWPEAYNQHHPYQWVKGYLTMHVSWSDLCQRIEHILWGLDWGLIYTAPYILLGFLAVFFIKYPNKKYFICLMGVLLVNFYIIMIWGSQGGWYGYRYMIASAIPLFVMPIAMLIKNIEQNSRRKWTLLWIAIAVPPALSMICFEGNSTTLTLHSITQFFGRSDWGNNTYQVAVWQTMTNIHEIWQPLFKGGMYYVLYLLQVAGLSLGGDKMGVFVRYPIFEWKILIQTGMFYTMPFIIGFIFKKIQFRISKVR
jgi:hypothetical protein